MKFYAKLLVAEFLVIAAVITTFKLVPERLTAGAIAGSIFVALGVFIFVDGIRRRERLRTATFVAGCLHLFGASLPLMITRLLNRAGAFAEIKVLGLPGPVFHRVSTAIFLVLIVATVFDLVRSWKMERALRNVSGSPGERAAL